MNLHKQYCNAVMTCFLQALTGICEDLEDVPGLVLPAHTPTVINMSLL
jgi:hypothetical protein